MPQLKTKLVVVLGYLMFATFVGQVPAAAQSWSNGYAHRRTITLSHDQVPNTDQTNFPVLISGTYSYLATTGNGGDVTNSSGYDIVFTSDAGGASSMTFERESYNSGTGAASFWVSIPTLSHTTDTVIYMFYGNSSVTTDQSNKNGVWDSNYKGVWHFNQTPSGSGSELDSTSNAYNGTPASSGIALSSDGIAGSSLKFDGTSSANAVTMSSSLPGTYPITVSTWVKTNGLSSSDYSGFVNKNTWSSIGWGITDNGPSSSVVFFRTLPNYSNAVNIPRSSVNDGKWHYLVGTINTSRVISFYIDGALYGTSTPSSISADTSDLVSVGGFGGSHGGGLLTEVRISNSVRTADWITTEYNNQNNPSAFYSIDPADWSNGYSFAQAITISHTKVPNTDQVNFPALVSGTYSNLATTANGGNVTNSNGYDIIFTSDPGGASPLPYERESYSSTTGAVNFWVKVPTLSHTTDTVIYMFYGNSSVTTDQSNENGVWDGYYKGVWHLPNGTTLSANDSTSNGNNGTVQGTVTATSGQIGGAASLDGSTGYISTTTTFSWPLSLTTEAWINTSSSSGHKISGLETNQTGTGSSGFDPGLYVGTNGKAIATCFTGSNVTVTSSSTVNNGSWHHLALTLNTSTYVMTLYVDGTSQGNASCSGIASYSFTGYFRIGSYKLTGKPYGGDGYFGGKVDEARLSAIDRSTDWIASEYNNQSSPSTFYSLGSAVSSPSISSLSPTSGVSGVSITITGTNFGSTQGSSTVSFNGTTATPTSWSSSSIVVPVPVGAASGNVTVFVSGLASNGSTFTVTSPSISSLSPSSGPVGTSITILGYSFGSSQGSSTITFNGTAATPTSWSATSIVVPVPYAAASGNVVVSLSTTASNGLNFTVVPPAISGLSPSSGPVGTSVTISGSNFGATQGSSTVTFGGTVATPTSWSATSIVVPVPTSAGSVSVVVNASGETSNSSSFAVVPVISTYSATTGSIGSSVVITGSGFGASQGSSSATLNGSAVTVSSWSATSITVTIPTGAISGAMLVASTPSGNNSNSFHFAVTSNPLPSGWLDQEIGTVPVAGSATYSSGTFTVNGSGAATGGGTVDELHYAYQSLSGDGTIIARLVSQSGSNPVSGLMIRETLATNSKYAFAYYAPNSLYAFEFGDRSSTSGGLSNQTGSLISLPEWVKLTRSGSSFSVYESSDRSSWTQVGSSVTVSMATNVYVGIAVDGSLSYLDTATYDNVSIDSSSAPAPVISSLSATTGPIGSSLTITGSNFGASQGSSLVTLNNSSMVVDSWSSTSITITIASGSTSGSILVLAGASLNASDPVTFTVTSAPLPSGWLDTDIGTVPYAGTATYTSGTFTVNGSGLINDGTSDALHFVYQSLSGDGTIVARLVTSSGDASRVVGLMIRESLAANSTTATIFYYDAPYGFDLLTRSSTGGSESSQSDALSGTLPYWLKLTRSGSSFTGYESLDGVYWTQIGSSVTISMATNVYIGLDVDDALASGLATATYDNVSVTAGTPYPAPNITGISPTSGGIGTSVTVSGSSFGATQGSSTLLFNGATATSITSWSDTAIVAAVPSSATTGPVTVVAYGIGSNTNVTFSFYNPVISSLLPAFGPAGGIITISGSGFGASQGSSTVQFSGVTATSINAWSDTSISVLVPTSATSGPVTVTVGGVTSAGSSFSVIEAATVTGMSPTSGPVGTSVVITGTGFGPSQSDSVVSFYGANATTITSWSDTSITVTVPSGTTSGYVSVTVAGITVAAPNYTFTFSATVTDSLGNSSNYATEIVGGERLFMDSDGSGCSTCTARGVIHNTYDSNGNILSRADALGNVTTYTYNTSNNLLSETVPINGTTTATTSYTYNSFDEVLTVTDPLGNVTTNAYDTHGNLTSVTSPVPVSGTAASVTTFAYNSLGELTSITDPLSHVTAMTYTTAGLVATITDAQSNVTTYAYDSHGNRTSITDALSHVTGFAYDSGDRLTTITYPDSTTSAFTYDSRGRRTTATDQNGKTTTYAYDDEDRLTSVTDAASNVTYYTYDTENNLTEITDANSHSTFFTYDAYGRVTNTNFPSSLSETYAYDANNNLTSKTDRKSQTINYVYDAMNRLTSKTYPDSTAVDYVYDLVGKITQVNDPTGTYAFAYDNMGRLIGTTTSYSFLTSRSFTNAYTYDAASNRTGFTDPESGSTTYSYDTLNRLTSLAPPSAFGSGSFGFSYDALSRRTQMTRPNSVATNYTYDNLSRLTSVLHQLSGSTIDGTGYTLDSGGNRTAKVDHLAAVTSNYTYDAIYQLTQATQGGSTTESYTYDPVGNRTASLGVSSYTTNASNEMTANTNASYTYDSNGNTLTKVVSSNTTTYAWDYENRLTSVTLPSSGGTVTFKYDPMGRRLYKSLSTGGTSVFAYDGDNLIEETNSSGTVVARYEQTQNIDEPLAMLRSSTTSYYNADGLGTVTSLANGSGTMTQSYTYDSFGKQTASSGSVVNPFQYTGRELDSETGLYYYRARYYDEATGRFVSEDPIRFNGGANFYAYVKNSPSNSFDLSGLEPTKCDRQNCPSSAKQAIYKVLISAFPPAGAAQAVPRLGRGGVFQVGLGGGAVIGIPGIPDFPIGLGAFSGSASLAFDKYGDIALVLSGSGIGNGTGAGAVGGVQVSTSPTADNVFQLGGPSVGGGLGGGAGLGGGVEGSNSAGGTATVTIGAGIGRIGASGQAGWTKVIPLVCP